MQQKKSQHSRNASKVWVKKDKSEEEQAASTITKASCKGSYSETTDFPIYSRGTLLKFLGAKSASQISTPSTSATDSDGSLPSGEEPEDKILQVTLASAPEETTVGNGRVPGARRALKALKKARTLSDASTGKAEVADDTLPVAEVPTENSVEPEACTGHEVPTTLMLRNIPNQYTRDMLCSRLTQIGFDGQYDFLYLPIDYNSKRNMGYAFINFRTSAACKAFTQSFDGVDALSCLPGSRSSKVCEVRRAEVQGLDANLKKMRSLNFIEQLADHEDWQPLFFDKDGNRIDLITKETCGSKKSKSKKSRSQSDSTTSSPFLTSSAASPYLGASPAFMPMMPPMPMLPYELPGLYEQVEDGFAGSLRAEAPEFVPGSQPTNVSNASSGAGLGPDIAAVIREARVAAQTHQATLNALAARNLAVLAPVDSAQTPQEHINDQDDEETKVKKQIEYYFSVNNICHDAYLRSLMDENGWVHLEELVRFPRLCALTSDASVAASAVAGSAHLEVDQSERRIRIKKKSLRDAFPRAPEGAHRGAMLGVAAEAGSESMLEQSGLSTTSP